MVSPVPRHIIDDQQVRSVRADLRDHVCDLTIDPSRGVKVGGAGRHRAKFTPGLATALHGIAQTDNIGDPMAGVGTLAHETGLPCKLNDIDASMAQFLDPLVHRGCHVTYVPATEIDWRVECCIFSPPYYPRTDRRKPNAHNDNKRGPVVGFRDKYDCNHPLFVGNPGGVNAIAAYRQQMTDVYAHLTGVCERMIVVTKNWMRLGVELRLDIDTILMAEGVGWRCVARHGFEPPPSLWSRFNAERGTKQGVAGMITIEDVLVFELAR
jgi:hypothetical protein